MKRIILVVAAALICAGGWAQTPKDVKYVFTEASDLNLIGKILKDTPNPYHRVDTVRYKCFTKGENGRLIFSARVQISPQFLAWCVGFGEQLKILSPASAVAAMRQHLAAVAALYPEP